MFSVVFPLLPGVALVSHMVDVLWTHSSFFDSDINIFDMNDFYFLFCRNTNWLHHPGYEICLVDDLRSLRA